MPDHHATTPSIPGIAVDRVTTFVTSAVPELVAPLDFHLIAGGRSNLTFAVTDANGRRVALRRPPVSHVLPTAHDMAREHRIITALGPTPVPVPMTVGLCTDPAVNGAPFYVMEFVDGHILRTADQATSELTPSVRGAVGAQLAGTLAALHAIDVDVVGLGDLARRDGYIERQVKRWLGQFEAMAVPGVDHGGIVEAVGAQLLATVPEPQRVSIVHGDYRLDNTVVNDDGQVIAILDWEICTLGDPLADLGTLLCYWAEPGDGPVALMDSPTLAEGFATRDEVTAAYAAASGLDVSRAPYYTAFGFWRLACILQGVYARYVGGAGAGDQGSVDGYPAHIRRLAELAQSTLAGDLAR